MSLSRRGFVGGIAALFAADSHAGFDGCRAGFCPGGVPMVVGQSGGASFSPTSITGLKLWVRAEDIVGVADGGAISTNWPDRSGLANDAVPTSGPLYRASVINGKPGVEFNSAGRKFVSGSFLDSTFDTAFSVYGVVKRSDSALKVWASNNSTKLWCGGAPGSPEDITFNTSGLSNVQLIPPHTNTSYLAGMRYDGVTKQAIAVDATNHRLISAAATGNLGLSGGLTVGDLSGGGFSWPGQVTEILAFKASLSDADELALAHYLANYYGFNDPADKFIYFDGNSLTSGTGASDSAHAYPAQTLVLLGSGWSGLNIGVGGATTTDRSSAAATAIDAKYSRYRPKNIAVLWEITNALYAGAGSLSAADAHTQYSTWCSGRRSAGFKVVAVTVADRNSGGYAGFRTDAAAVNTLIRANWTTYADALADVASDSRIGSSGAADNATYFSSDKVHMVDAGYAICAGIVKTALLTL